MFQSIPIKKYCSFYKKKTIATIHNLICCIKLRHQNYFAKKKKHVKFKKEKNQKYICARVNLNGLDLISHRNKHTFIFN